MIARKDRDMLQEAAKSGYPSFALLGLLIVLALLSCCLLLMYLFQHGTYVVWIPFQSIKALPAVMSLKSMGLRPVPSPRRGVEVDFGRHYRS